MTDTPLPEVDETLIQNHFNTLQLPFPFRCEIEYNQFLVKDTTPKIIPYILVSVDKMLTAQERALIPDSFNGIRTMMEYQVTLDSDGAESIKKEMDEEGKDDDSDENDVDVDDDDDDDDDDNKMKL